MLGANEEILAGVVGLGGRGSGAHVPGLEGQKGVSVVAIADPDKQRTGSRAEQFEKKYGHKVDGYQDMRKLFARKDIDVIGNATQNYWHGLSTIWACQAGKHVYCEKPLSHYIWEGRQMVNAARKYNRLVQCGTQRRSQQNIPEAIKWLREGHLGKITCITAFANKPRGSIGKRDTPLEIPETVDYDLWCGPAKKEPIYRNRLQYDCSFCWNTGDGESCNQGVHEVDVARWVLGVDSLPRRGDEPGRAVRLGGRGRRTQHADHLLRLRRSAHPLRGPQHAGGQGLERNTHLPRRAHRRGRRLRGRMGLTARRLGIRQEWQEDQVLLGRWEPLR